MIRLLDKFLDLPASAKRQLLHTALVVTSFRLGLWLIPFRILSRMAERTTPGPKPADATLTIARIGRQVVTVARRVPGASCLTQALSAQVLLRREGLDAQLRIGVARGQDGQFKAHAWVLSQGRIVVGDMPELADFSALQSSQDNLH